MQYLSLYSFENRMETWSLTKLIFTRLLGEFSFLYINVDKMKFAIFCDSFWEGIVDFVVLSIEIFC